VTSKGSKSRIRFEGDSQTEIKSWPSDVRADLGLDPDRLDRGEDALKSEPVGKSAPGIHKLNDQDRDFWYRVFYAFYRGLIYVLHCFKKKTNKIPADDLDKAKSRFDAVKARIAVAEKATKKEKEKEKRHA
jgi:phage-related protein